MYALWSYTYVYYTCYNIWLDVHVVTMHLSWLKPRQSLEYRAFARKNINQYLFINISTAYYPIQVLFLPISYSSHSEHVLTADQVWLFMFCLLDHPKSHCIAIYQLDVGINEAIGGQFFVRGRPGERFAVQNSGCCTALIEGVGDHGCEYMTAGTVVNIGYRT